MTQTKKIVAIFSALFGITFFVMLLSFIPGDKIEFTNLNIEEDELLLINDSDPVYGSLEPEIVIFHFGDFANESSAELAESFKEIADEQGNIAIVWKDFPNTSLDADSRNAAIAARCAQKQDSFWEFHDYLFSYNDELSNDLYLQIAQELNLWEWSFNRCIANEKTADLIDENITEGVELSITASPTFFINGAPYSGNMSKSAIESIISSIMFVE